MAGFGDCEACGTRLAPVTAWMARCGACGFLASTLSAGPGTGIDGLEDLRRANFEILLDGLARLGGVEGKRLLEVGSAWGWFLEAAQRRGAIVHGIEPETSNAELCRRNGFAVEDGLFPDQLIERGPYDVIVFNDVLEHIPHPSRVMQAVSDLLSSGGLAVVNLPSSRGALYAIARVLAAGGMTGPFDRMWQKGFPSPHISYFSPANLKAMVERHTELREVGTFPLPSVSRQGLWPRIRSSHPGPLGLAMYGGIWALSFGLGGLPADIHVGVFRKPE